MLPTEFSKQFQERVLDLIWSQWISLGVPGGSTPYSKAVIDPEALTLFTCTVGRRDPRVFDAMINWINKYQHLLNAGRLKRMLSQRNLEGGSVFCAVLEALSLREPKWESLSNKSAYGASEPLFQYGRPKSGREDPAFSSRGYLRLPVDITSDINNFNPEAPSNLIMTFRTMFGVNSRSEVFAYLLTHKEANSRRIALDTYYLPKTVYNILSEMEMSGRFRKRVQGRAALYSIKGEVWKQEFLGGGPEIMWLNWPLIFSIMERVQNILVKLEQTGIDSTDVQAEVMLLFKRIEGDLSTSFPVFMLNNEPSLHPNGTALTEFHDFWGKLLIHIS